MRRQPPARDRPVRCAPSARIIAADLLAKGLKVTGLNPPRASLVHGTPIILLAGTRLASPIMAGVVQVTVLRNDQRDAPGVLLAESALTAPAWAIVIVLYDCTPLIALHIPAITFPIAALGIRRETLMELAVCPHYDSRPRVLTVC